MASNDHPRRQRRREWFVDEQGSDLARPLLTGSQRLIGPSLLILEVARASQKREIARELPGISPEEALADLFGFFHEIVRSDDLVVPALALAREIGHPIYDCIYLALAVQRDTVVMTADEKSARHLRGTRYARYLAPLDA